MIGFKSHSGDTQSSRPKKAHDNPVYHVGHEVRRSTNRFVCLLRGYGPARLKQSDEISHRPPAMSCTVNSNGR